MTTRVDALASPVTGLRQNTGRAQEHSRGRQVSVAARGVLAFPARGRQLLPSVRLQRSRNDSRKAAAATPCWAAPATPSTSFSRLSVSCGAGIAQPGEVRFLDYSVLLKQHTMTLSKRGCKVRCVAVHN